MLPSRLVAALFKSYNCCDTYFLLKKGTLLSASTLKQAGNVFCNKYFAECDYLTDRTITFQTLCHAPFHVHLLPKDICKLGEVYERLR